jgi:hypothetical protein
VEPEEYRQFTRELAWRLSEDLRVLGLVAVGSMAEHDYGPDRWSDHDFFVLVQSGEQESFRTNLSWLPRSEEIVFSYRETPHGVKVIYDDAHLIEFAVFDTEELSVARVNRYRVLLDRADVEGRMAGLAEDRRGVLARSEDVWLFGQFLTNLLVGAARFRRGEQLSGHQFVKSQALGYLLVLLEKHLPSPQRSLLDDLDPSRRFERAYPALGAELHAILTQDSDFCAQLLLRLADRELKTRLPDYPSPAVEAIGRWLAAADPAASSSYAE